MSDSPFLFGMPEEIREELQRHVDRSNMEAADFRNGVKRLLDELKPDQLLILREILYLSGREGGSLPVYLTGKISAIMQYKHGVCESCGEDCVAASLRAAAGADIDYAPAAEGPDGEQLVIPFPDKEPEVEKIAPLNRPEAMTTYNLRDVNEGETDDGGGVVCRGCGKLYQSLEDRMRRSPSLTGCDGCVEIQKWG